MRQWNLNPITVLKILKCFMTNGCRKWRNRFKIEQFVALAEYLEQLPDCNRYKKIANREKTLCGGISRIYLSFSNIWKPCHGAINIRLRNLRTALEKYFRFYWNCKQLRVEARNRMSNSEIYFPVFSETIHTILKIFTLHSLRKSRKRLL